MKEKLSQQALLQRLVYALGVVLISLLLLLLLLSSGSLSTLLFQWTGEEQLFPQVKGLTDLAANLWRPNVQTANNVPVTFAGVNPFGVNVFLEQEVDPEKRVRAVQMIAEAGFHWIRQEFPWEDLEIHGAGDYEDRRHEPHRSAWDKYDHIVSLAEKYGLEMIVRLSNPPEWTREKGTAAGTFAPPDDYDLFGDFVEEVIHRYQGRIRYYQIWNEPNIYPEWGEAQVNPQQYVELLKIAYSRAKAVDPDVVIISGALAATIEMDYRNLSDFIFLQQMYDAGAQEYFDILAVQGYGLWSGPTDRRMQPRIINYSHVLFIRDIMVKNGDAAKSIWISEMNWNAVPQDVPDKRFGMVSEEQQARYAVLAYQRVQAEWPWVGVVNFWYFKRPDDRWKQEQKPEYYFRMVEPDFTPLPVYNAIKEEANKPPVVYPGVHQEDHWALHYEGAWKQVDDSGAALGAIRRSDDEEASLSFAFDGTELTLVAPVGAEWGQILVEIDGKKRNLNLSASQDGIQSFNLARRLGNGLHQVVLHPAPDSQGQPIAIDQIVVGRQALWLQPALLILVTVGWALGLLGMARRWGRSSSSAPPRGETSPPGPP